MKIMDLSWNRRREVEASMVCGSLAVHRTFNGDGWAVTHRRSGLAVVEGVPTKEEAVKIARALRGLNWKYDWGPESKGKPPNAAAVVRIMARLGWVRRDGDKGPFIRAVL